MKKIARTSHFFVAVRQGAVGGERNNVYSMQ